MMGAMNEFWLVAPRMPLHNCYHCWDSHANYWCLYLLKNWREVNNCKKEKLLRNDFEYIVTITNIMLFKVTAAIINKVNLALYEFSDSGQMIV